eukprot:g5492.t1
MKGNTKHDGERTKVKVTYPFSNALVLSQNGGRKVFKYDESVWDLWSEVPTFDRRKGTLRSESESSIPLGIEFVRLRDKEGEGNKQKDVFVEDAMQWRYIASHQPPKKKKTEEPTMRDSIGVFEADRKKILPPLRIDVSPQDDNDTENSTGKKKETGDDQEFDIAVLTGHEGRVMNSIWELADPRGSLGDDILKYINSLSRKRGERPLGRFHLIETLRSLLQKHLLKQTSVIDVVRVRKNQQSLNIYGSKVLQKRGDRSAVVLRETSMLIPDNFQLAPAICSLALKDCRLRHVPSTISTLSHLKSLSLSDNSLRTMPSEIFDSCTCLESLVLNNNQISVLPRIDRLRQLKLLWLSFNRLSSLPEGIERLTNLTDICVNDNKLDLLPEGVGCLSRLRRLSAAGNNIRTVPLSTAKLVELEHLDLQRNRLQGKLPEELGQLVRLKTLLLSHNKVEELHASVGQMTSLKDLVMTGNQLKGLPESVLLLTQLTELRLLENPLEEPKEGSVWRLGESTDTIAKEKIDQRAAKRSSMALSRDAFVRACGLKAGGT